MSLKKLLLILSSSILFFLNTSHGENSADKSIWIESCPNNNFCFMHPQDLHPVKIQIIDSNAGQYQNDNTELSYDLGWYASQFNEMREAQIDSIEIDGLSASILVQNKRMALRIPQVKGKVRFSMLIEFKKELQLEQGRRIFTSIKFMDK
ncbi:MAG: hypothetical protein OCD00_17280 [Colwellia sp.]